MQSGPLLRNLEFKGALARACAAEKLPRLTHGALRHLFATHALESGVDASTVALWLRHRDKGALVMKRYGHIRQEHSRAMAGRVRFT